MNRLVERCAGLDVHKVTVTATVRVPGSGGERDQNTETFATTTKGLLLLLDWLQSYEVVVDGDLVYSKKATGRHAEPQEILKTIRSRP